VRRNLKDEVEFIDFLSKIYIVKKTGKSLTTKVISDTLGRINRLEKILNIKIEKYSNSLFKFKQLSELIKSKDTEIRNSVTHDKYGYGKYIYAARLYFKYSTWKNGGNYPRSSDKRIND
jgi:hypothetical protein